MYPKDLAEIIVALDPGGYVSFDGQELTLDVHLPIEALAAALKDYEKYSETAKSDFRFMSMVRDAFAPQVAQQTQGALAAPEPEETETVEPSNLVAEAQSLLEELNGGEYVFYDGDDLPEELILTLEKATRLLEGYRKKGKTEADRRIETNDIAISLTDYLEPGISEEEREHRYANYVSLLDRSRPTLANTVWDESSMCLIAKADLKHMGYDAARARGYIRPSMTLNEFDGLVMGPELRPRPVNPIYTMQDGPSVWLDTKPGQPVNPIWFNTDTGRLGNSPQPHEHHAACTFGSPDCPGFDDIEDVEQPSFWSHIRQLLSRKA